LGFIWDLSFVFSAKYYKNFSVKVLILNGV